MSTLAVTNTLASVFVPIGIAGAVIAVACALVTAFALARGAAGLAGGGIGVWIVGAMLSLCASFALMWVPFLIACGSLAAAFVFGAVGRMLWRGVHRARTAPAPAVAPTAVAPTAVTPTVARSGGARTPARGVPPRTISESVRVAS
ncbi:hypothetical protein V2S04_01050 [Microbacterium sp. OR21]|uniref:hypothetical protein n=1 Tax=Microbacterium sp. OR21 TaxID=3095346 RepID=UPI0039B5897D